MSLHKFEIECNCAGKIRELKKEWKERIKLGDSFYHRILDIEDKLRINKFEEKLQIHDAMIEKLINLENVFYKFKSETEKERPILSSFYEWLQDKDSSVG